MIIRSCSFPLSSSTKLLFVFILFHACYMIHVPYPLLFGHINDIGRTVPDLEYFSLTLRLPLLVAQIVSPASSFQTALNNIIPVYEKKTKPQKAHKLGSSVFHMNQLDPTQFNNSVLHRPVRPATFPLAVTTRMTLETQITRSCNNTNTTSRPRS